MVDAFWGFVPRDRPMVVFGKSGFGMPAQFGLQVLDWCRKTDLAFVEPVASKVKAVRPSSRVSQATVRDFPFLHSMHGSTWGQALAEHDGDLARTLLHGVNLQPTLVDPCWGYVVNFRERTLDVYAVPPLLAVDDDEHLVCGLRMVVQFYLDHLPDPAVFLESIAEEMAV